MYAAGCDSDMGETRSFDTGATPSAQASRSLVRQAKEKAPGYFFLRPGSGSASVLLPCRVFHVDK
jgi:hypothetical protein